MRELGRSPEGHVSLTDGFYNLTLLKRRDESQELGLARVGIAVDDLRELEGRLEEYAPDVEIEEEPGDLHHGEYRVADPSGIAVSISTRNFHVPDGAVGLPRIRHIAYSVPNNEEMLNFYVNVFGFREAETSRKIRERGDGNTTRFAADGSTSLAILRDPESMRAGGEWRHLRPGVNHFGFLVDRIDERLAKLGDGEARPSIRPMTEYRVSDPEGTGIDVSQFKGYEIDDGVWVNAAEPEAARA
jgi:catechol 2,3-dioxygenase-like lactoylglutathione lyase family enzyme